MVDDVWVRRSRSFGSFAREYAEHRPDYAPEALRWALAGAQRPVAEVLDLGAGTGALSGGLLELGLDVTAVDPDAEMLRELGRRLPGVRTLEGSAEAIPLPDACVDAVLVGTALHWFDLEAAGSEIRRVLRRGGVLGVLYDLDDESVDWVAEVGRLSRTSVSTPAPDSDRVPDCPGFAPFEERRFPHAQRRTAVSLTATIGTHSHTRVVSPAEREETLARVRSYLESRPETGGEFDRPLVTVAARTVGTAG